MAVVFDSLDYTKGAEAVGIKREHAEYQAKQMMKLIDTSLATKSDINDIRKDMIQLEQRLLIKVGGMMVVCSGIIIAMLGFILKA